MEHKHSHKHIASKLLALGLIIIIVRNYTEWDMWTVIGALLIIKALILYLIPCKCDKKKK